MRRRCVVKIIFDFSSIIGIRRPHVLMPPPLKRARKKCSGSNFQFKKESRLYCTTRVSRSAKRLKNNTEYIANKSESTEQYFIFCQLDKKK